VSAEVHGDAGALVGTSERQAQRVVAILRRRAFSFPTIFAGRSSSRFPAALTSLWDAWPVFGEGGLLMERFDIDGVRDKPAGEQPKR